METRDLMLHLTRSDCVLCCTDRRTVRCLYFRPDTHAAAAADIYERFKRGAGGPVLGRHRRRRCSDQYTSVTAVRCGEAIITGLDEVEVAASVRAQAAGPRATGRR